MKLRNSILTALTAIALTATGARAQEILANSGGFNAGYTNGDLVLAFYSAGDSSVNGNVLFDLGSSSSFTGLAAGTYSVAGFNGSATSGQATPGFGTAVLSANETVPSASTYWTVMGSLTSSAKQLWLTSVTTQQQASASTQSATANIINSIGNAGIGGKNADGSAFDFSQATGNALLPNSEKWANFAGVAGASVSSSSNVLNLYSLLPGTGGGGSATKLGYFTLTDTAGSFALTFTAIPEPSTYAAILGALTVGFVLVRRRFGATGLSTLA